MATPHPLSAAALFNLKNWVIVVTGGGTGVGLMMSKTFAANGARVYITGRRADVLQTSAQTHGSPDALGSSGGEIIPLLMDVTKKDSILEAVGKIGEKEGYINVLVNNAGVWIDRANANPADGPEAFGSAMFAEEIEATWQQTYLTNATSSYFVTAAFLPLLAKAANSPAGQVGSVINNASVSGLLRTTQRQQYSYNASKAAAIHISRQMAYDLSHDNVRVRVNGLALGYFPSEMTTGASDDKNESSNENVDQFRAMMEIMGTKMVKRMGNERDLASAVLTLATNDYLWGSITILDGGFALTVPGNM